MTCNYSEMVKDDKKWWLRYITMNDNYEFSTEFAGFAEFAGTAGFAHGSPGAPGAPRWAGRTWV